MPHDLTEQSDDELTPQDREGIFEAPALLSILWKDPQHTAEHIALWSVKRYAGRAKSAVQRIQHSYPDVDSSEIQRRVVEEQTSVSMRNGAVVGGPFIVLIPVAFCAALLAQAQMALELAAVVGHSPADETRAADLLILQGAYGSEADARTALQTLTRVSESPTTARFPRAIRWSVLKRMALLLGLLDANQEQHGWLRRLMQWTFLGFVFVVGCVLPLVWVPYMAMSMRRSSLRFGERGLEFYAQKSTTDVGVAVQSRQRPHVRIPRGVIIALILAALPVVLGIVAYAADVELGTGRVLSAMVVLIAVSALTTVGWLMYLRWRSRRRRPARAGELGT